MSAPETKRVATYAEIRATRTAEAIFALFGPLPPAEDAPEAVAVRDPQVFVGTLESTVRTAPPGPLRQVAQAALDAWNAAAASRITAQPDGPRERLQVLDGIAWTDNVVPLSAFRPAKAWDPLDAGMPCDVAFPADAGGDGP
jgi:hypothetical protein